MSDSPPIGRLVEAPFTPEQVEAMNAWQRSGMIHPFTCRNTHRRDNTLVATVTGWSCPRCDYTQDWAHQFQTSALALAEHRDQRGSLAPDART